MVASYENYKFQKDDVVTAGILKLNETTEEYEVLKEVSVTVPSEAEEVQLEFSREDMFDIDGDVILEVRTVTAGDVEMTIQKSLILRKDGVR